MKGLLGSVVIGVLVAGCAGVGGPSVPQTTTQSASAYRLVQTSTSVSILSGDRTVLTVAAGATGTTTTFADGTIETMKASEVRAGRVNLGDGRTIILNATQATLYAADGTMVSSARTAPGGIVLTSAAGTRFVAVALTKHPLVMTACQADWLAYDIAIAAEVAGGLSLDPIAVALAITAAELEVTRIQVDC